MKVPAETLELRSDGNQIGVVDLSGQVAPSWPMAADLSVRVLELVELALRRRSPMLESLGWHDRLAISRHADTDGGWLPVRDMARRSTSCMSR